MKLFIIGLIAGVFATSFVWFQTGTHSSVTTGITDTAYTNYFPTKEGNLCNILVLTVPNKDQPYKTPGSYAWNKSGQLVIKVSEMGNWRYSYAVAMHELVETALCVEHGVTQKSIDSFDRQWHYIAGGVPEPGADTTAPYHKEHMFALKIEHEMADQLGLSWDTYNAEMEKMQQ